LNDRNDENVVADLVEDPVVALAETVALEGPLEFLGAVRARIAGKSVNFLQIRLRSIRLSTDAISFSASFVSMTL
jgi:hypothetical protein